VVVVVASKEQSQRRGKAIEESDVAHRARCMAAEYLQVFRKRDKSVPKISERWSPPADGIIKFNSDGFWVPGRTDGAWGVVARDAAGEVIAAKVGKIQIANDAFAVDLRAMEEAINLASDLGVIRAVFETDSQILAQALNRRGLDYSLQGQVIDGLKAQLTLWFSGAEVRACGRTANAAAHEIAKLGNACSLNDVLLWEYDCPAEIAEIVSGDIANMSV
jgi:ribonuclease HI